MGDSPLPGNYTPGRSPGPLGYNDAADPNAGVCIAADTPGPVGTGGDAGQQLCSDAQMSCEMDVPVLSVDFDKMRHLLYTVAYAEAADQAASRGFASAEISLGDQRQIEAAARKRADELLDELQAAMAWGPESVRSFIEAQEQRKERARASLKKKLADALKAGKDWESFFGGCIKVMSGVKFASTVTVKTVSIFTGLGGTAIDIVYSGATAGIEEAYSVDQSQSVAGVVVDETLGNTLQAVGEELNEMVGDGLMTQAEKNRWQGLLGNYKGNRKKLAEQIEKLAEELEKAAKAKPGSNKVARLTARHADKVAKLKRLSQLNLVRDVVSKNPAALGKKAAGKALSVVFLSMEVKKAWDTMNREMRAAD